MRSFLWLVIPLFGVRSHLALIVSLECEEGVDGLGWLLRISLGEVGHVLIDQECVSSQRIGVFEEIQFGYVSAMKKLGESIELRFNRRYAFGYADGVVENGVGCVYRI